MSKGISTDYNVGSIASALAAGGIDFVFRYYSAVDAAKCWTKSESDMLSAAGLQVAVVYEDGPTSIAYFSKQRGLQDSAHACHLASQLQQPAGSAIYFAVDYDASIQDVQGAITDYFNGVVQGMANASGGNPSYDIGIYGSGLVCSTILSNVPGVSYSWLSESTGYTGTSTYSNWDVKQSVPTCSLCSLTTQDYEDCVSAGSFGAFQTV